MENKKIVWIGLVVLAILGFIFLKDKQEIKNAPPSGRSIIAFGDSLVAGEGASTGNDFVSVLSRRIGIPIVNLGKSGDTTESALVRLKGALALRPDVVLVLLGGNDALGKVPLDVTKRNLSFILEEFQSSGAVVVLLGVRGGLLGDPYDNMYEKLAQESDSLYLDDVLKGLFGNPKYMSDAVHPNDAGYARIAERVAEAIEPLFKK